MKENIGKYGYAAKGHRVPIRYAVVVLLHFLFFL